VYHGSVSPDGSGEGLNYPLLISPVQSQIETVFSSEITFQAKYCRNHEINQIFKHDIPEFTNFEKVLHSVVPNLKVFEIFLALFPM
jgi:hypothetical protein